MDKKDEILKACFKHFAKRGYNVAMADIAKEVGIKTPSLYSHFGSKEEILYLTIEKELGQYLEFMNKVYEEETRVLTKESVKTIFFRIIGYFKDYDTLRFWRNILLIEEDELRKKSSERVFFLEMHHLSKLENLFSKAIFKSANNKDEVEGNALQFLSMIQASLEIELLFYNAENRVEEYVTKIWNSYSKNLFK